MKVMHVDPLVGHRDAVLVGIGCRGGAKQGNKAEGQ